MSISYSDIYSIIVAIVAVVPTWLLILGVLWTPFAVFICRRIAHARGLDVDSYGGAGAGYSALFFLPWIYLVVRMLDRNPPSVLIRASYVLLYVCWFALIGVTSPITSLRTTSSTPTD